MRCGLRSGIGAALVGARRAQVARDAGARRALADHDERQSARDQVLRAGGDSGSLPFTGARSTGPECSSRRSRSSPRTVSSFTTNSSSSSSWRLVLTPRSQPTLTAVIPRQRSADTCRRRPSFGFDQGSARGDTDRRGTVYDLMNACALARVSVRDIDRPEGLVRAGSMIKKRTKRGEVPRQRTLFRS